MRWLLVAVAACGGLQRGTDPTCLVEAPLGSDAPHADRVDVATEFTFSDDEGEDDGNARAPHAPPGVR